MLKQINHLSSRLRFKFVLPYVRTAKLAGVRLDVSKLSSMMKNIILTGRYEHQERHLASNAIKNGDVILELGGAIGFIGLFCRTTLGAKHVTSVEPNPKTLEALRRNYTLNGLSPNVVHAAAADADGELDLNIEGEFWENTLTGSSSESIRVPTKSLSSLVKSMPENPTVLICDIEGAEQYLDFSQLPNSVTRIIIELHPEIIGQDRVDGIIADLENLRFTVSESAQGTALLTRPEHPELN